MEANILEVRGFVPNRNFRKFSCYLSVEELGATQERARAEGISVSRLARGVMYEFIESGLSLSEYKEYMLKRRKKGKAKKK